MIALVRFRDVRALGLPILVLAAVNFISQIGIAVMLPLLPLYGLSLHATPLELGILTSSFAATNAIGQFVSGFALDRVGVLAFIRGGTALYAGANALIATATSALSLIAYRSLAGLGGGANIVASRLYVAEAADPARLAFTQGILSAASSAGQVAGPAIGGLVSLGDLRYPFIVVAVTSGIAFVGTLFLPRPRRTVHAEHAALPGGIGRPVAAILASQVLLLASYGAFITVYAAFATQFLGWSTLDVAILFTVFAAGDITLGAVVGYVADRTGRRRVAIVSLVMIAIWNVLFVAALPRLVLYAYTFFVGAALTGVNGAMFALLTEAVPRERRGRVFGVVSSFSQTGVIVGALVGSVVWQQVGLAQALVAASAACLAAIVPLFALPRTLR